MATAYQSVAVRRPSPPGDATPRPLEFPGCRAVRITRNEIEHYEGRLEYWDADTELAMVCEPTTVEHELPSQRLARLIERIAAVRGSPIETFGTADLLLRNARGERYRILQADQMVYLNLKSRPWGPVEVLGGVLPDVVLEVDNTTDVRRGKLELYRQWGLPEVWVEVPDKEAASRPRSLRPGLTIYRLASGTYQAVAESKAFAGWTAAEIHAAMNTWPITADVWRSLDRVGLALGALDGTGPDDDPWLHSHRQRSFDQGMAEGMERGLAEGMAQSRAALVAHQRMIVYRLATRRFGAETAAGLAERLAGIEDLDLLTLAADWVVECASGEELIGRFGSV